MRSFKEESMLEEQLLSDFKQAMKDKDAVKSSTISFLRSQMKYVLIEKKTEKLSDADVVPIIKKQIKQRQDSIEQFEKGGRKDLVDKEKKELDILKSYLPQEMPESEIKAIVEEAVREVKATSMKDMGAVMKALMPKVAGKADSKLVSDLVKEKLSHA